MSIGWITPDCQIGNNIQYKMSENTKRKWIDSTIEDQLMHTTTVRDLIFLKIVFLRHIIQTFKPSKRGIASVIINGTFAHFMLV